MLKLAPAPGLIPVVLGKGCLLLLTAPEFERALARGKAYRRQAALAARCGQPSEHPRSGEDPPSARSGQASLGSSPGGSLGE